ncbi:LuxR C-terminal-related transcriptional regulator [Dactylosporangium sp. NPDC005555]|uniref:LuxR C-terminal-related transcriptional regulator n=1 Tax=Dactylosporangium sp. NPDC005555 TaxID=3154889 RepID=UPI0033A0900D
MLIERDHERDLCCAALTRLRAGQGGVLAVTGDLGAGKSALLMQAAELALAGGVPVVAAVANRVEQGLPRSLASRLWRDIRASAAARTGTLLVTVDDLQWADDASLAWLTRLHRLTGRAGGVSVLVVLAVLDGDAGAERPGVRAALAHADRTSHPARLTAAGVERLLAGTGADRATADRCHRLSGGNPSVVRAMAADVDGWSGTGGGPPDITGRAYQPLRRRVTAAVAALPEALCAYLLRGVLLGADAEPGLVGRLAGLDDVDARTAARALRAMGLHDAAEPQPVLDAVVRHVVGTTICPESFAVGHLEAAEALYLAGAPAERVAAHLEQAVTLDAYAPGVLSDAAASALARHDVATAVRYLRVALRGLPPGGAERARVLVDLAVAERCGNPSTLVRRVLQALPELPDDDARAAALARIPPMALQAGADAAGEAIARHLSVVAAAEPARDGRPAAAAALTQRLEARLWMAGWQDPAVLAAATAQLRGWAAPPRTPAERELAGVLLFCATMLADMTADDLAPLAQLLFESLPADHDTLASIAPLLVAGAVAVERVPALQLWLMEARRASDAEPCRRVAAQVHTQLAFQQLHIGRPGPAAASALNALTVLPDGFGDDGISVAMLFAVAAAVPNERLRQRAAALCRAERANAETGMLPMVSNLLYGAMQYTAEPQAALAALIECEQQLATHGWHNRALFPIGAMIAPLLHRLGRPEEALERIAEEHRLAAAWGSPAATGRTLRIWGELSRGRQALRLLDDAVEVLERSVNELELSRALLARGTRLLATGRRGAGEDLRRGGQLAAAAGFSWLMEPANVALEAHHEQLVPGFSSFTPSERTVTELVTAGLTNQAIATRLGISQRAVEKHLTNCYRKLGVTNRSALKAVLNQVAAKMSDVHFE